MAAVRTGEWLDGPYYRQMREWVETVSREDRDP